MLGNFSLFKTLFLGWSSVSPSFVSFFCLLYFFLPPFEELGCFSGYLMSSAGIQKLFCGIYLAFKCSFDEFVGEKVYSPSYSCAILAPPVDMVLNSPLQPTSKKLQLSNFDIVLKKVTHNYLKMLSKYSSLSTCVSVSCQIFLLLLYISIFKRSLH